MRRCDGRIAGHELVSDAPLNPTIRAEAANALGNLGPEAKVAIPQLTQALKDPNKTVRGKAARALVEAGPEAVPALIDSLKDKDESVRDFAVSALWRRPATR